MNSKYLMLYYMRSRYVQDEVFPENDLRLECASRS